MLEVKTAGLWIFQSVHDTYGIAHLVPRIDYSHLVKRLVDGPFEDIKREGGGLVLSAQKIANARLSEILGSPEEAKRLYELSALARAEATDERGG